MKKHLASLICLLAVTAVIVWPAHAQDQGAQLFAALDRLKQQQTEIAESQTKTDEKIATLAETIRVARLFMSRAGGKHKPPQLPNQPPPANQPPPLIQPPPPK